MNVLNAGVRSIQVGCTCIALLIGPGGGATAQAVPHDDGEAPSCVYTLSTPFVVDVSGVKMVSATLKSLPCTGSILPNDQTVCVELQGGTKQCKNTPGYTVAQVYFAPYRPGSTYVSTGIGCGSGGPLLVSVCATQGPLSATL